MIYIEETLKSSDIPADLKPHLVYGEIQFGARKPTPFVQVVREDTSLIGQRGTKISIEFDAQMTASTASESTIDSAGYSASELSITDIDIVIGDEVYAAFKISKTLLEDKPDVDWVRNQLQNAGLAVTEYLDAAIRDALITGAGTTKAVAITGTTAVTDLNNAVTEMKKKHWYPEAGNPFICFLPNEPANDILNSTTFTTTERYTAGSLDTIVQGEIGRIAGMKVVETSAFSTPQTGAPYLGLIVAPPTHSFGPSTILAWKRKMDVVVKPQEEYARTMYVVSARYGIGVVNSDAICLLSNC
jgi:hypothetical protein